MPVYNAEKYIKEAIDSILSQTFSDFELIVADDGSADSSKGIIDSYSDSRIVILHNEINRGKTATVQRLFGFAKGEYVTVHDADDISLKTRFEKQVNELESNHELIMCGTSFTTIDNRGKVLEDNEMESDYEKIKFNIKRASQFHGPTMMFRKSAAEKLGEVYRSYFRDNYEDTDLAYRLLDMGKAYNLKERLYLYRILPDSLCRRNVDERNRNLYKVVAFLGEQRKKDGVDCLMRGQPDEADIFFEKVLEPYRSDKARIHREAAAYFMYWKLYSKAIGKSMQAIKKRPLQLINWRTLFYCVRKSIFK